MGERTEKEIRLSMARLDADEQGHVVQIAELRASEAALEAKRQAICMAKAQLSIQLMDVRD